MLQRWNEAARAHRVAKGIAAEFLLSVNNGVRHLSRDPKAGLDKLFSLCVINTNYFG